MPDPLGELLASGEAQRSFKALAMTHADGKRWLTVGLGPRRTSRLSRARRGRARPRADARDLHTSALLGRPGGRDDPGDDESAAVAGALVEETCSPTTASICTSRAGAAFLQCRRNKPKHLDGLIVSGGGPIESAVADAAIVAAAVNAARDLQPARQRPHADGARRLRAALGEEIDGLQVEVQGRAGIAGLGMGAFAAVAQGSEQDPALIVLRYEGGTRKVHCWASSARPSRSTAAASR